MMKIASSASAAALVAALSCFGLAGAAAAADPAAALAADTATTTTGGARFTAPAGWRVATRGDAVTLLTPPEADSTLALVDVRAADAEAAVAAAWPLAAPGQPVRPLRLATPQPARNGWQDRKSFSYETSPNERRSVSAFAWRAAAGSDQWLVGVLDATTATAEKRGSQFGLAVQSLRPKGYEDESFAGRKANALDAARIAKLEAFVEDGMRQLDIPGVSIALVQDGRVVLERGFGVKTMGKPGAVDAKTLFIAASNTKAMTTLLLAQLVDDGKLRWDEPVTEADPRFRLGDPATTKQVQVKHLVCACTGMPRQDLEWIFDFRGKTPASTLKLLSGMQPTSRFGEVFQYSNLMVSAAGYVAAQVARPGVESGRAYDALMKQRIFTPLGMNDTTFDFRRALAGNHASPHGDDIDGGTVPGRMDLNYAIVPARPAGGVWTSAHDLIRYVQMELAEGVAPDSGQRIVSAQNLLARREPQVAVGADASYGMGLFVNRRYTAPLVEHGGDLAGYHSNMMWLPEHGVGAVILTNSDSGVRLRGPFQRKWLELLFDGRPEADEQLRLSAAQRRALAAKERERLQWPPDAAAVAKLASVYADPSLGSVAVRRRGSEVVFDAGEWASRVATRRNDDGSTSFITIDPNLEGFEFVAAERDGRPALLARDAQHEYVFRSRGAQGGKSAK